MWANACHAPREGHGHEGLTPSSKRIQWLCDGMGGILLASGSVTANKYKAVPSGHLYSVTKHFFPRGSSLFEDDSTPIHMAQGFTEWFESLAEAAGAFEPTALLITITETVQISLDELCSISQVEWQAQAESVQMCMQTVVMSTPN